MSRCAEIFYNYNKWKNVVIIHQLITKIINVFIDHINPFRVWKCFGQPSLHTPIEKPAACKVTIYLHFTQKGT